MNALPDRTIAANLYLCPARAEAGSTVSEISDQCVHCKKCVRECSFLQTFGTPGQLARKYGDKPGEIREIAFSCSLCTLCTQLCPVDLEPATMFLELRREAVILDSKSFRRYRKLLAYERLGSSRLFGYLHIPQGSHRLFFPGCALPGARPEHTLALYHHLRRHIPDLGVMLDCCNKPSHDLGRQRFFLEKFQEREESLYSQGIRSIITACPNCYQAFSQYSKRIGITTIFTELQNHAPQSQTLTAKQFTLHDPCSIRFQQDIHFAVRSLVNDLGIQLTEMEHSRETTYCCGEGGAAGCTAARYAAGWSAKRHGEAEGLPLITYCAGCTSMLQHKAGVHHLVDLLFPDAGDDHVTPRRVKPPATYLRRLKVKWLLKKVAGNDRKKRK